MERKRTAVTAPSTDPAYEPTAAAVAWVARELTSPDWNLHLLTLTRPPDRDLWFSTFLADLDWEVHGGTWDEPRWAFMEHPWFEALGLTREECEDYLARGGAR